MSATQPLLRLRAGSGFVAKQRSARAAERGPRPPRHGVGATTRRRVSVRDSGLRWLVAASIVFTCALLALHESPGVSSWQLADEVTPVPAFVPGCRLQGEDARAYALALAQSARARWQRVPFDAREAPRALVELGAAEGCYAVAGDRSGRLRSMAVRHVYEAELERRFAHARLLLRALTRQPVDGAHAPQQRDLARAQIDILLALLERAPPSVEPLRRDLLQLDRSYAGQAPAALRTHEVRR